MDKKTSKRSGQYRWNFLQNFANPLLSSTKEYLAVASRPQGIVRHLCQFYNSYNFLFYKEHQGLFWSLILILGNQRCKKVSLLIFSMTTRCTCCLFLFTPPNNYQPWWCLSFLCFYPEPTLMAVFPTVQRVGTREKQQILVKGEWERKEVHHIAVCTTYNVCSQRQTGYVTAL